MSSDPATDRENLLGLQRGDAAALNRLIERWQRPLLSFAYRYVQNSLDAQDIVAEAFVRLFKRNSSLRPDTNLAAWLFTTIANLCHNHHRWKRRHPTVALGSSAQSSGSADGESWISGELPSPDQSPDTALERDEALEALKAAIDKLPHDLKVSVLLHHYEHLSYKEIASAAGCSERGVETRLYRARQLLRQQLARFFTETR